MMDFIMHGLRQCVIGVGKDSDVMGVGKDSGHGMSHPRLPPPKRMKGRETILGLFTCFFRHLWSQVL